MEEIVAYDPFDMRSYISDIVDRIDTPPPVGTMFIVKSSHGVLFESVNSKSLKTLCAGDKVLLVGVSSKRGGMPYVPSNKRVDVSEYVYELLLHDGTRITTTALDLFTFCERLAPA